MLDRICEMYPEESFLKADGFDEAIIGVDTSTMRLIYSITKCIELLIKTDGMEEDEAVEFFEFNTRGAYVGEQTPIWCEDMF